MSNKNDEKYKDVPELTKKTIRLFKRFAIDNGFYARYLKLSRPLNNGVSFIKVVNSQEPISLIQSSTWFCSWPITKSGEFKPYDDSKKEWRQLSYEWGQICADNELWHDKVQAIAYARSFIYWNGKTVKFDLNK